MPLHPVRRRGLWQEAQVRRLRPEARALGRRRVRIQGHRRVQHPARCRVHRRGHADGEDARHWAVQGSGGLPLGQPYCLCLNLTSLDFLLLLYTLFV